MLNFFGLRSLSAKLGFLMAVAISVTVTSLTILAADRFSKYIEKSIEERSVLVAEKTAGDIGRILDASLLSFKTNWAASAISSPKSSNNEPSLSQALRESKDVLAATLYILDQSQARMVDRSIQPEIGQVTSTSQLRRVNRIKTMMDALATELASSTESRLIRNSTVDIKYPSMIMAFKTANVSVESKSLIIVFMADMTQLQMSLPHGKYTDAKIIDRAGMIFASSDDGKIPSNSALFETTLFRTAIETKTGSGFLWTTKDSDRGSKIGGFAPIPNEPSLLVVIEQDHSGTFHIIRRLYFSASILGFVILLLALLANHQISGRASKKIREITATALKISNGDFSSRIQPSTRDELGILGYGMNVLAAKISAQLVASREAAQIEKDVEISQIVHSTLCRKLEVNREFLRLAGSFHAAKEYGGDVWGHFKIRENVELVYIGDVMGRGVAAALPSAMLVTACRSFCERHRELLESELSPAHLLDHLNKSLHNYYNGQVSATFFAAVFDLNKGVVTFSNAGHVQPFGLTTNKDDSRISKNSVRVDGETSSFSYSLNSKGNTIGRMLDSKFTDSVLPIVGDDKVIFFTNGITSTPQSDYSFHGRKILIDNSCKMIACEPMHFAESLQASWTASYGTGQPLDDATVVVVHIAKEWVATPTPLTNEPSSSPTLKSSIVVPPPPPSRKQKVMPSFILVESDEAKTESKTDEHPASETIPRKASVS